MYVRTRGCSLTPSRLFATILALQLWVCGCASTDRYYRTWELRRGQPAASQPAAVAQLSVGMSKTEVRELVGSLLEESSDYVWKLKEQFAVGTLGLYPYFDGRQVYLYFDEQNRLAAINVRGSYTVYP